MKILLLSQASKHGTYNYCKRALEKHHTVFHIEPPEAWNDQSPIKSLRYKLKTLDISAKSALKELGEDIDFILEVDSPCHMPGIEKTGIPSAFWAIDTHIKPNVHRKIAPEFDHVFVAQKDLVSVLQPKNKNSHWLPLACDPGIHRKFDVDKRYDISFVGNVHPKYHRDRKELLDRIGKKYDLHIFNNVFMEDMAKLFCKSKITFNRSVNGDLNMRVFEALSTGSFLLTDDIKNGLHDFFENGLHMVMYKDNDPMELIGYYLKHETEREMIAKAGFDIVRKKHTYEHRMKEIISISGL